MNFRGQRINICMIQINDITYLTPRDVSGFYGCDLSTLRHARRNGKLIFIFSAKKTYLYELKSIETYFGKTFEDKNDEEIKRLCLENNCAFIKKELIGKKIYVTYMCSCGNKVRKVYFFGKGISKSCMKCLGEKIRKPIDTKGHEVLSITYSKKPNNSYRTICKLKCKCCGAIFTNEPRYIGEKCKSCYRKLSDSDLIKLGEEKNHEFVSSRIKNGQTRAIFKCGNCGETFEVYPWMMGERCKYCTEYRSLNEKELCNEIDTLLWGDTRFKVIPNDREFLRTTGLTNRNLEIDIMIFKENSPVLGIEWNGEYWHSLDEAKEKDELKYKIFKEINIPLVQIDDPGGYNADLVDTVFNDIKNILRKHICL